MMTIKAFARLCACNTQTLRYYDRIDLLKPIRVDPWSGYRYYASAQAVDFVKIKNLQAADFSIDEIKALLTCSDQQIYEAFARKIEEQNQKLERIREIQQSYLKEKTSMEKIIQSMSDFILGQMNDVAALKEFAMKPEDVPRLVEQLREYFAREFQRDLSSSESLTLRVNDEIINDPDQIADRIASFTADNLSDTITLNDSDEPEEDFSPAQYETVWEKQGWSHVYEFIDEIPEMEGGWEYCFLFRLTEDSYPRDLSFPLYMLGAMTLRKRTAVTMGCSIDHSTDGENHFALLRRR